MTNKQIAYKVVDRIVEMINEGKALPWVKPWSSRPNTIEVIDGTKIVTLYPNAWNRNGKEYRGANVYLPEGEYITYNQCKKEGGNVKKGAKGFPVVYWNFSEKIVKNEDGEEEKITIPFLKYYTVFNVNDCEGIEQKHHPKPQKIEIPLTHTEVCENDAELNEDAEKIIADYIKRAGNGFEVKRNSPTDRAYYSPMQDYVRVPMKEQYKNINEFYSTLFHELGHSTGHSTRLNRFSGSDANASFGSQSYSKEELVAESTAATMLNYLGLEDANSFRNSAGYIKSWAEHIKNDPLMYVSAMAKAQMAVNMILGIEEE